MLPYNTSNWIKPRIPEDILHLENTDDKAPSVSSNRISKDHPLRLSGGMKDHYPVAIPPSGRKKFPTRVCRVCKAHSQRRETRYVCKLCNVALHAGECFTRYHTLKNY
ncbi:piggyBac transposable element-derived protein 4-like isoform X2 [Argiope bruennichi]|nr:piggyBac transposable element-derived protein 4-like isoform X2 [Argiope bruennichi]